MRQMLSIVAVIGLLALAGCLSTPATTNPADVAESQLRRVQVVEFGYRQVLLAYAIAKTDGSVTPETAAKVELVVTATDAALKAAKTKLNAGEPIDLPALLTIVLDAENAVIAAYTRAGREVRHRDGVGVVHRAGAAGGLVCRVVREDAIVATEPTIIGDCTLYNGDCLEILPTLAVGSVDAVVTDPPYSSGGQFRGDRMASTASKYQNTGTQRILASFTGDNRDQRSFLAWCSLWLIAARAACTPGAVACMFTDWRQLPTMTDAMQCGGWVWRNIATWWKPGMRMQKGRFSSSAEYVVYGTNGPHDSDGEISQQNVFRCAALPTADRDHQSEKPVEVVEWVTGVSRPRCLVLDPFMGSGTTGVACIKTGRRFIGIELDPEYFRIACDRIRKAYEEANSQLFKESA